ncbi:MAG: glycosyltransferase family 1 protein [Pseudomonadota bacterium]
MPLRWWLALRASGLAKDFFASPRAHPGFSPGTCSGVLVAHWGESPSLDYYFRQPQVAGLPVLGFVDAARGESLPRARTDLCVVVLRYVSAPLLRELERHVDAGGRVVFFMDDDLPRNLMDSSLPWAYRSLLWERFGRHLAALETLCAELWVSTPTLAERYVHAPVRVIPPGSGRCDTPLDSPLVYFYHGSPSTHRREIEWLRAVVEQTQSQSDRLVFMAIGDRQVRRLFADLPRVLLLHAMPWLTYRDVLPSLPHHVGLAPLLATDFNATRSVTRFYDFVRLDAVGLYSAVEPYQGFVRHDEDGWLLPNEPHLWSEKIIELSQNPGHRLRATQMARARCERGLVLRESSSK